MAINGTALLAGSIGIALVWSGINNKKVLSTVQSVVRGQRPVPNPVGIIPSNPAENQQVLQEATGQDQPLAPGQLSKNQALGKLMAAPFGWSAGQNWDDLVALWNRESGWNNHAENGQSGAYGIPQALPASKMGPLANPPLSSASAQIAWGLGYIKERYGSPTAAWAHEESAGWY